MGAIAEKKSPGRKHREGRNHSAKRRYWRCNWRYSFTRPGKDNEISNWKLRNGVMPLTKLNARDGDLSN
jgi:hypothetical protein